MDFIKKLFGVNPSSGSDNGEESQKIIMNKEDEGDKKVEPTGKKVSALLVKFIDKDNEQEVARREFYGHLPVSGDDLGRVVPVITGVALEIDETDVIRASAEEQLSEQ